MADKKKKKDKPARPKEQSLPGMEDREIEELQNLAIEYAEKRDERMALLKEETDLKTDLLAVMQRHHKIVYDYQGVHIRVVHEDETVKVRIDKGKKAKEKSD
jgi:hypothetical protein